MKRLIAGLAVLALAAFSGAVAKADAYVSGQAVFATNSLIIPGSPPTWASTTWCVGSTGAHLRIMSATGVARS